jgi:hypothetical protein
MRIFSKNIHLEDVFSPFLSLVSSVHETNVCFQSPFFSIVLNGSEKN